MNKTLLWVLSDLLILLNLRFNLDDEFFQLENEFCRTHNKQVSQTDISDLK